MSNKNKKYFTKNELATIFGVSTTTVDNWLFKGLPFEKKGTRGKSYKFSLPEVIEWRINTKKNQDVADLTLEDIRKRKELADAEMKELELEEKKGSLVPVEEVKKEASALAVIVGQRLYSIPSKIAPFCYGKSIGEIKDIIYEAIDEAIGDLHNNKEKWLEKAEKVKAD